LAIKNTEYLFGWAPTENVLDIIDEAGGRPKSPDKDYAILTELTVIVLLTDAAFVGKGLKFSARAKGFGFKVLETFGLLLRIGNDEWMPTARLCQLLVERDGCDVE
jgi:hypothetical protein